MSILCISVPTTAKVKFPSGETKEMTADEICALDEQGLFTIMHDCNYGVCDHWTSVKPSVWVRERFWKIYEYDENDPAALEDCAYDD